MTTISGKIARAARARAMGYSDDVFWRGEASGKLPQSYLGGGYFSRDYDYAKGFAEKGGLDAPRQFRLNLQKALHDDRPMAASDLQRVLAASKDEAFNRELVDMIAPGKDPAWFTEFARRNGAVPVMESPAHLRQVVEASHKSSYPDLLKQAGYDAIVGGRDVLKVTGDGIRLADAAFDPAKASSRNILAGLGGAAAVGAGALTLSGGRAEAQPAGATENTGQDDPADGSTRMDREALARLVSLGHDPRLAWIGENPVTPESRDGFMPREMRAPPPRSTGHEIADRIGDAAAPYVPDHLRYRYGDIAKVGLAGLMDYGPVPAQVAVEMAKQPVHAGEAIAKAANDPSIANVTDAGIQSAMMVPTMKGMGTAAGIGLGGLGALGVRDGLMPSPANAQSAVDIPTVKARIGEIDKKASEIDAEIKANIANKKLSRQQTEEMNIALRDEKKKLGVERETHLKSISGQTRADADAAAKAEADKVRAGKPFAERHQDYAQALTGLAYPAAGIISHGIAGKVFKNIGKANAAAETAIDPAQRVTELATADRLSRMAPYKIGAGTVAAATAPADVQLIPDLIDYKTMPHETEAYQEAAKKYADPYGYAKSLGVPLISGSIMSTAGSGMTWAKDASRARTEALKYLETPKGQAAVKQTEAAMSDAAKWREAQPQSQVTDQPAVHGVLDTIGGIPGALMTGYHNGMARAATARGVAQGQRQAAAESQAAAAESQAAAAEAQAAAAEAARRKSAQTAASGQSPAEPQPQQPAPAGASNPGVASSVGTRVDDIAQSTPTPLTIQPDPEMRQMIADYLASKRVGQPTGALPSPRGRSDRLDQYNTPVNGVSPAEVARDIYLDASQGGRPTIGRGGTLPKGAYAERVTDELRARSGDPAATSLAQQGLHNRRLDAEVLIQDIARNEGITWEEAAKRYFESQPLKDAKGNRRNVPTLAIPLGIGAAAGVLDQDEPSYRERLRQVLTPAF